MSYRGIAVVAGCLLAAPGDAWAQGAAESWRYGYGPHMMGWGGGWAMVLMPLAMIVVFAVVIALAVMLVRWLIGSPGGSLNRSAVDILRERFARGEIDQREFDERRHILGG